MSSERRQAVRHFAFATRIWLIPLALGLQAAPAHAWHRHEVLMPWVVSGLSAELRDQMTAKTQPPCGSADQKTFEELKSELVLQKASTVGATATEACARGQKISLNDVLLMGFVDDPDEGMDQNLPDSADPKNERKYMGGAQGQTSQGFRHMFFGGWKPRQPVATFQVPFQSMGQAPERAQLIATKGRELLQSGQSVWGMRLIAWAMHYLQDLAQPFHTAQIPNLRMVPWSALFQWPPSQGFSSLVAETTRTISNYHWAYEGYVYEQMQLGEKSPFADCLLQAERHSTLQFDPKVETPRDLALKVSRNSVRLGPNLGSALMGFFGTELKKPEYNLPANKGSVDAAALAARPDLEDARKRLEQVTCSALANGAVASRKLIEWAMMPAVENR